MERYCIGELIEGHPTIGAAIVACENNRECSCIDDADCDGDYWYLHKGYGDISSKHCAWIKSN